MAACAMPAAAAPDGRDSSPPGAGLASEDEVIPGQYVVVYADSVRVGAETRQREEKLGFEASDKWTSALDGFAAELKPRQVDALRRDPEVEVVAPDRPVASTESVPLAPGEPLPPTGLRRILAADEDSVREQSDVAVAVLDTGVQLDHPDLDAAEGTNCIQPGQPVTDVRGHGTHVAGTIAAQNDGDGVVGVAPGTRIYAVKVLGDDGKGTVASVICGIDWVTAHADELGIEVANMSLSGGAPGAGACPGTTDPEHLAICASTAAGVNYVVSAGNEFSPFDDEDPLVPAAYPEVLTVTALSDSDGLPGGGGGESGCFWGYDEDPADFSNFAATPAGEEHTIAAPGVCIRSTEPGSDYGVRSGTSMAAPHVAGVLALCIAEGGEAGPCAGESPAEVIELMRAGADTYNHAYPEYGFNLDPLHSPNPSEYYGFLMRGPGDEAPPPPPPPPPNDDFAAAEELSGSDVSVAGRNTLATKEPGEPDHAGAPGGRSVWYRWIAPESGTAVVSVCDATFDTTIAAYTGTAVGALTGVADDDDTCRAVRSRMRVPVEAGSTYHFAVDGGIYAGRAEDGAFTFRLRYASPPANDPFTASEDLGSSERESAAGTNVDATAEVGEPQHDGRDAYGSVWYRWTAPRDGRFQVETCDSDFSAAIGVYLGESVGALTSVADASINCPVWGAFVGFLATEGTTYRFAVDGFAREEGNFTIEVGPEPPANDRFSSASFLFETPRTGTNVHASKEAGEPDHAGDPGGASVWYRWRPEVSGTYSLDVCNATFDSVMGVYTGGSFDPLTELTEVASDDDGCLSGTGSRASIDAVADTNYWVAVDGAAGAESPDQGTFTIRATETPLEPANDAFASAQTITGRTAAVIATNVNATKQAGEPDHAGDAGGASVWFRWTAPTTARFILDTCNSDFDSILAVYRGTGVDVLSAVASDDDGCATGAGSRLEFDATRNQVYRIAVDGIGDGTSATAAQGEAELNLRAVAPPNDAFGSSQDLGNAETATADGNTNGATREPGEPMHGGLATGASIWFHWSAPYSGEVELDVCGSLSDPQVAVYTGAALADLTLVAPPGASCVTEFDAEAGTTYRIALDSPLELTRHPVELEIAYRAPVNDMIWEATSLGTDHRTAATSSNIGATHEPGEPQHAGEPGSGSVWFRWIPPAEGRATVDLCDSSFDTTLAVYSDQSLDASTLVASDDDSCGPQSRLTFEVVPWHAYMIAVDGAQIAGPGSHPRGRISLALNLSPDVDAFGHAVTSSDISGGAFGVNSGATKESGEPDHAGNAGGRSVWFAWTSPVSGPVNVQTCDSLFDTLLGVYTGGTVGGLTRIAANDDACGERSSLQFDAVAGRRYLIAVDGKRQTDGTTDHGYYQLQVWPEPEGPPDPPPPPPPGPPANPPGNTPTDVSSPETSIRKARGWSARAAKVRFSFKASERAHFECALDSRRFDPCKRRSKFKVGFGRHDLRVRAIDSAGNVDRTPAKESWTRKRARHK